MNEKTILVTGATGQQGGATVRHLIANGWSVRALTRDPGKPAARAIADRGAEVVRGDLNDPASLKTFEAWAAETGALANVGKGSIE